MWFGEKNNREPPLQLFYYRDGVSDSEFDAVYQQEYQAIAGLFSRVLHMSSSNSKNPSRCISSSWNSRIQMHVPVCHKEVYNMILVIASPFS